MNKKLRDALPYFKAGKTIEKTAFMKKLATVKSCKCLYEFIADADKGKLSPREADRIVKTKPLIESVNKFNALVEKTTDKYITTPEALTEFAKRQWRLEKFAEEIPWDLYKRANPELSATRSSKLGKQRNPETGRATVIDIVTDIALRTEILSRKGGFFADRLLTATSLGAPFERIKESREINLPVALEVLQEFYPGINEQKIREITETVNHDLNAKNCPNDVGYMHMSKEYMFDDETLCKLCEASHKILKEAGYCDEKGRTPALIAAGRFPH